MSRMRKDEYEANRNIKLILEYDGTNYHGWQSQIGSGKPTIQDTLEHALYTLTTKELKTYSSGRTDAGVHALGHVANFITDSTIPPHAWAPAINQLLPPDIRVLLSDEAAPDFHARFSALGKTYKYRILNRRAPTALDRNYAWHVNVPLNVSNMSSALTHFIGKHDFSAFRGSGCGAKSPVRHVAQASIDHIGDVIEVWIEADAFLQYMVRNITGTLVEVGLGRFSPDDVKVMLESRDRTKAGKTAPSQGLYLVHVNYPK
jgi:tRNA pseudouridine38-40 synthase